MKNETFKGPVSRRQFRPLVETLEALDFITRIAGYRRGQFSAFAGPGERSDLAVTEAKAATFTATSSFLALAEAVGVTPENVEEHFVPDGTGALVVLKAGKRPSVGNTDTKAPRLDFRAEPRLKPLGSVVDTIEAELVKLNEFTARFPLSGATHHGFYRTFGMGDHPSFRWNKGGRVISRGNYQTISKEKRLGITIGGEPLTEIDVEASHLTLAYGLLGITTESMRGAYEVEGLPLLVTTERNWTRWAVKAWTTISLGAGKAMARWPEPRREEFREKTGRDLGTMFRPSAVAKAMMEKHPLLKNWQDKGVSWADLQYAESQAIIGAMVSLMEEHGVPALPLHDALLVRTKDFEVARDALSESYRLLCSFHPSLVWNHSQSITVTPSVTLG